MTREELRGKATKDGIEIACKVNQDGPITATEDWIAKILLQWHDFGWDHGRSIRQGAKAEVCRGTDPINHPAHYTSHPSGVECIQVTEHMSFNVGNAVKYLWRAGLKTDRIEDLKKAAWYINREIERLSK